MAQTQTPSTASKSLVFLMRSASTLGLWALVSAAFLSRSSWAFLALIGLLAVVGSAEYFRMLKGAGLPAHPRFGLLMSVAYCAAAYAMLPHGGIPPELDMAAIFLVVAGAFTQQLREPVRGPATLQAVALSVLGFVYVPFLFGFLARIVFVVPGDAPEPAVVGDQGAFLLLWVLAVTKFTDMGAYITGSLIGRHKMIPHISPGKTWEGFAGALVFSQAAGCGLFLWFPEQLAVLTSFLHVAVLGLLVALLAVVGDLAESLVKRSLGAKDSGRFLPGIGGSLDLIDSVCFTAPAVYLYLKWLLLPSP